MASSYPALLQALDTLRQCSFASADFGLVRRILSLLRETKARKAEALPCGRRALKQRGKLGSEAWDVYEQTLIAALDAGDLDCANECFKALRSKYPSSFRVRRLEGMILEAQGDYDAAIVLYTQLLSEDAANPIVLKRRVAIHKAQGQWGAAVDALNAYLKVYQADADAWSELADLYISLHQFTSAQFCFEELILSAPQNSTFHLKYAEVLFTIGGLENFKMARKYYIHSMRLAGTMSLRCLYGCLMATVAVAAALRGKSKESAEVRENADVEEWVRRQLLETYSSPAAKAAGAPDTGLPQLPVVKRFLAAASSS
eukprot:tig00000718_g3734.t1